MAKLKGPLMSLGASGSIAHTLVFFPWKGINAVREYVIPSNPKTTLQTTQRGLLTTIVDAIHASMALDPWPLDSYDQIAYNALAQAKGRIITWFNQAVKLGIDALVAEDGYTVYTNGHLDETNKEDFRPFVHPHDNGVLQVADGKFYLGTSKTNLVHSIVARIDPGVACDVVNGSGFTGLTAGVKYYWQFRPDAADPCELSVSGIYYGVAV
ncbi:hypothetical protein ES705_27270 [subsurface metagenome]